MKRRFVRGGIVSVSVSGGVGDVAAEEDSTCRCIVCRESPAAEHFMTVTEQRYWRCPSCRATFMDPSHRLTLAAEKARYEKHENDPHSPGYRRFLGALVDPLLHRLGLGTTTRTPSRGLDYGCGPGPALAAMLREAGHEVIEYDPIFAPNLVAVAAVAEYDFVTCTEVSNAAYARTSETARHCARTPRYRIHNRCSGGCMLQHRCGRT